jgi:hypothetical protein
MTQTILLPEQEDLRTTNEWNFPSRFSIVMMSSAFRSYFDMTGFVHQQGITKIMPPGQKRGQRLKIKLAVDYKRHIFE